MAEFLLEIGLEEIPARMIDAARDDLARRVGDVVTRERLAESPKISVFSTPRRLAVLVAGIATAQPDVEEQLTGPAVKVAFKDGAPTPAAEAFARKAGIPVSKLQNVSTPKGDYLAATVTRRGRKSADVLSEHLPKEIAAIYWAKSMYWRAGKPERFVRPVRWITALLDGEVVPFAFGGVTSSNNSRGHRLLGKQQLQIVRPADYCPTLEKHSVLADPAARKKRIEQQLDAAVRAVPHARWRRNDALLQNVVNLTEFPSVVAGGFEREYLRLPEEVLVTVMRDHQKYFAVEDSSGKLLPYFLAILNTDGDPVGLICHGNERVLRARFNDARFFWETDQKIPLADRVETLRNVTFQKDLGSYWDKARRMALLVDIGGADFDRPGRKIDRNGLHQAAWLAKTDLTTELVKEFTELQGVVGGLYAKAQGLGETVATAIYDQYRPESIDAAVPRTLEGALLALADKTDTIAGMFALGMQPTGSKDPFGLRRAANGIVKIIAEHKLPVDLKVLFKEALAGYKGSNAEKKFKDLDRYETSITDFMRERLGFYLRETRGFAYDEVNAVLTADALHIVDAEARAQALAQVRASAEFESISMAFKRIKNILRQATEKKIEVGIFSQAALVEPAERDLFTAVEKVRPRVAELRAKRDYVGSLSEIASLRPALDAFFDRVMVIVDDPRQRSNRLALLAAILKEFSVIADFSEIVTEKK